MLPDQIKALEIKNEALSLETIDCPKPNDQEVLIKVHASGVNRADILQRKGLYPAPEGIPDIPGLEIAGEVVISRSGKWSPGDKVCALLSGGGYASYVTAPAQHCLAVPAHLSFEQAAAMPETFLTIWHNLFYRHEIQPGQSILIHAGASGIGTAAIQILKLMDVEVFTTAGSDEKCHSCVKLGAKAAINYKKQDFVPRILELTNHKGVNFVLDMIGGNYFKKNLDCLCVEGTHISIAFLNGAKADIVIPEIMQKRLTLTGSTLRARSPEIKSQLVESMEKTIWPLVEKGEISPLIDSIFPYYVATDAHKKMERREHSGKIVLTWEGEKH